MEIRRKVSGKRLCGVRMIKMARVGVNEMEQCGIWKRASVACDDGMA
jgi:hypothetical protein